MQYHLSFLLMPKSGQDVSRKHVAGLGVTCGALSLSTRVRKVSFEKVNLPDTVEGSMTFESYFESVRCKRAILAYCKERQFSSFVSVERQVEEITGC